MPDSSEDTKSSDSLTSSSNTDPEHQVKQRRLETRILYTDYDVPKQRKMATWAKKAVRATIEKGIDVEETFFQVSNETADLLIN